MMSTPGNRDRGHDTAGHNNAGNNNRGYSTRNDGRSAAVPVEPPNSLPEEGAEPEQDRFGEAKNGSALATAKPEEKRKGRHRA